MCQDCILWHQNSICETYRSSYTIEITVYQRFVGFRVYKRLKWWSTGWTKSIPAASENSLLGCLMRLLESSCFIIGLQGRLAHKWWRRGGRVWNRAGAQGREGVTQVRCSREGVAGETEETKGVRSWGILRCGRRDRASEGARGHRNKEWRS